MSMNFFDPKCQEPIIFDTEFGICDDENGQKAYTNVDTPNKWITTVINEKPLNLTFTAIDKCVLNDNEYRGRGRCDCMLTSSEHLYLIELKNQQQNWKTDAIEQLESTIEFLKEYHNTELTKFKHKKIFACNKKHPAFQEIDNEQQLIFFRKYKFRIDVQASIVIL